jgi:proteic killer suppression protein
MILSFRCRLTRALFEGKSVPEFVNIRKTAERKLTMLDEAIVLDDLGCLPGNRLERLYSDLANQYSIRINAQWRLCFTWTADGPADVMIIDYH